MGSLYLFLKKVYYIVLNVVTFGRGIPVTINNFRLRLPARHYRHFPADYEKQSFDFFKKHIKPGSTIFDIGAHIGLYAVFFAKISNGKVYAFEPTPSSAGVLRKTVAINHCENNITVVPAAVSAAAGKAVFYTSKTNDVSTSNSLVAFDLGDEHKREGSYEVEVVSVDDFAAKNNLIIQALKIDAEGVELDVLNGARNTFLNDRPVAVLGLHPFAYSNRQQTLSEIWDKLAAYRMQVQMDGKDISKESFCSNTSFVYDVELIPQ